MVSCSNSTVEFRLIQSIVAIDRNLGDFGKFEIAILGNFDYNFGKF